MSPTTRLIPSRLSNLRMISRSSSCRTVPRVIIRASAACQFQQLHTSQNKPATPLPITAHGPPPKPPLPSANELRHRQKVPTIAGAPKRFWKEVHVTDANGGFEIRLDKRVVKTPQKRPMLIPSAKPLLAHAVALEWAHLRTSGDALKGHLTPLTQLCSRVIDMAAAEAEGDFTLRNDIVSTLIRYLNTDTLLCWAPTTPKNQIPEGTKSLREVQMEVAGPILGFLTTRVWPGAVINPADGDNGILPAGQPAETKAMVTDWMKGLDPWRLVGLERAILAGKSFLVGARLVAEWSGLGEGDWGVAQAREAASIEVQWQTQQWGEVEDSHDVEKEDIQRQIGAAWLLIVGDAA